MYWLLVSSVILLQGICYSQSASVLGLHNDYNTHLNKGVVKDFYAAQYLPRRIIRIVEKRGVGACTDVLELKQCKELIEMVENVEMPESSIGDALEDALVQGAVLKSDIYEKAVRYLEERMTCDMLISEELCLKIIRAAAARKVTYHEVDGLLQMLIAQGVEDKQVLTKRLMEFITTGVIRDTPVHSEENIGDMPGISMRNEEGITRSFKRHTRR